MKELARGHSTSSGPEPAMGCDSLNLAFLLRDAYLAYFESEFPIRDPELRRALLEYVRAEDGPLFRGPIIEVTRSEAGQRSVADFPLDPRLAKRISFPHPYPHQAQAWDRLLPRPPRNTILTSGTGSGKTEALLVPLINSLLATPGKGLQAILLYPMNALLQDQYARLTDQKGLVDPAWNIRVAPYTGSTEREERIRLRENPPDVLLTNYKMLELMLLRGELIELFERSPGSLRWLFFDELHTYLGVKGAEVALLNRRIKAAAGKRRGEIACLAASATVGEGDGAAQSLIAFARNFFDEDFDGDSLVGLSQRKSPTCPEPIGDAVTSELLSKSSALARLQARLAYAFHRPTLISEAVNRWREGDPARAQQPDEAAADEIRRAFNILWPNGEPAQGNRIEQRAHLFVRGAIGVEHPLAKAGWRFEGRQEVSALPLALCRECGEHGFLVRVIESPDGTLFAVGNRSQRPAQEEGAAWLAARMPDDPVPRKPVWNPNTGMYLLEEAAPNDPAAFHLEYPDRDRSAGTGAFTQCPFCSKVNQQGEQIRRIASGASSNVTVIAAGLMKSLPLSRRRLIAFADSRQDVALQAGFTNERSHRLALGALIADFAASRPGGVLPQQFPFADLFEFVCSMVPSSLLASKDERRAAAWLRLAPSEIKTEFFSDWAVGGLDTKPGSTPMRSLEKSIENSIGQLLSYQSSSPQSPESNGLLTVIYEAKDDTPFRKACDQIADEMKWPKPETLGFVRWFLDFARSKGLRSTIVAQNSERRSRGVWGLIGRDGRPSAFTRELAKHLPDSRRWEDEAKLEAAGALLSSLTGMGLLVREREGFRLSPRAVRLTAAARLFLCDKCRTRRSYPDGLFASDVICPQARCETGRLHPGSEEDKERLFYFQMAEIGRSPAPLHTAEHSAWVPEERRRLTERSYNEGKDLPARGGVNFIVASPTLEMGVDLKQTPVVLMRNVPPLTSSYRQRAGRAGRDTKSALVVTHAGANPYDRFYFDHPERMVDGHIPPLTMPIENDLVVARHIHSFLFQCGGKELIGRLEHWRGIFFDDAKPDSPDFLERDPDMARAEQILIEPLRTLAHDRAADVEQLFGALFPELAGKARLTELREASSGQLARLLQDRWVDPFRATLRAYREMRGKLHFGNRDAQQAEEQLARRILTHAGYEKSRGVPRLRSWAPLFFLAEQGFLPRYEFPGDLLLLSCAGRGRAEPFTVQEDYFKALREWAPGGLRRIHAVGRKFRPRVFRALVEPPELAVCEEHGFVGSAPQDRCPRCGGGNLFRMLSPYEVAADAEGGIDDSSEERARKGVLTSLYFSRTERTGDEARRVPLCDTLPEDTRVSGGGMAAMLYLRNRVSLTQLVGARGREGIEGFTWCRRCQGLGRTPTRHDDEEAQLPHHDEGCIQLTQGAEDIGGVVLVGHRDEITLIDIHLPGLAASLGDVPEGRDPYRSVLHALLHEGRVICQLGPRGEGLSGDVLDDGGEPYLAIYDPVPGGSGTIPMLWKRQEEWFARALARVSDRDPSGSGCDCAEACDRCLLDYTNQPFHGQLSRKLAAQALELLRGRAKAFWIGRDTSAPPPTDPVGYDSSSPLEKRFAELVTGQFGVRGSDLYHQRDAIRGVVRPDYKARESERYVFIDSREHHGAGGRDESLDWTNFVTDCGKRNEMVAQQKLWLPLTHRMIRSRPQTVSRALSWIGVPFQVPAGWEGQKAEPSLQTRAGVVIPASLRQPLAAILDDVSAKITNGRIRLGEHVIDAKLSGGFAEGAGDGTLLERSVASRRIAIRYGIRGQWDFDRLFETNLELILDGWEVYLLPLDRADEHRLRAVLGPLIIKD